MDSPIPRCNIVNFYAYLVSFLMMSIGIVIHLYSYILVCDDISKYKKNMKYIAYAMLAVGALSSMLMYMDQGQ